MFQVYEWIQEQRVAGKLDVSNGKGNSAIKHMLCELGILEPGDGQKRFFKKVRLNPADSSSISVLEGVPSDRIGEISSLYHNITLERNQSPEQFHTQSYDYGKNKCGHSVAFYLNKDFKSYENVDSVDSLQFGEIRNILEVDVDSKTEMYFKIEHTPVVDYSYGGIWYVKRRDNPSYVIVKTSHVSAPLLSCIEDDRIAVLNCKIRVPSLEAGVIIDHQGVLGNND